ncbi:MAG: PBP1A family penicillin-binding protein [Acidobacteriota bacterium]
MQKARKTRRSILLGFAALSIVLGFALGEFLMKDLPSVRNLEDYSPPIMTRLFSDDGQEIFRFGQEKRILINQKSLPEFLVKAIVATEDSRFYRHQGIDFIGVARAALQNLKSMQYVQGGSTLTQQLARNLFLKPEKTLKRKIQEAILALQIERVYTKEEILHFYCNQIYMGHGRYGIEAASLFYFGKASKDLSKAESAMLAGVLQRPESNSPLKNLKRAEARKNHVLGRMVKEGFLKSDEEEAIRKEKVNVVATAHGEANVAPYFVEEIRRALLERFGEEMLYRAGMDVYTTLNVRLQQFANESVRKGLDNLKKRHPNKPPAEAALVAIDPSTGEIKALVGGSDFNKSEFDRAVQAKRQAGSAFKPFILAAALENGFSPSFKILDEPIVLYDRKTENPYLPDNYTNDYSGLRTLREVIEQSINIPTVKLLNMVGYDRVIRQAKKMGIEASLQPYPSMALGSFEVTLLNLTSALSALPTGGIRMNPIFVRYVTDRTGTMREETKGEAHESISEESAFQMVWIMKGVVESGTAQRALSLGKPLAGKTGTTNDYTDAWFIGFSPNLICGVWVGYDTKKSLGHDETGTRAALPIWINFMSSALSDREPSDFNVPPGIVLVPVDKRTGFKASVETGCEEVILEAFRRGSEPLEFCSAARHFQVSLPYQILRLPMTDKNELILSPAELSDLLHMDSRLRFVKSSKRIEFVLGDKTVSIPVISSSKDKLNPEEEFMESRDGYSYEIDGKRWYGKDGRVTTVVPINEASQYLP